jgi:NAD(P)-dependent dehydrogenase (short-subunit alcohol dehydrogenase family)
MIEMKGKKVLVTGAARGIGFGIAEAFAEAGAEVALCDRDADTLQGAIRKISEKLPAAQCFEVLADVSRPEQVEAMAAAATERMGPIDVLINNAGFGGMRRFWEMPLDEWNRILETALTGTFLCSSAVVRGMLEHATRGKIINIASTNAQIASTGISAYCAAKGGVAMFTKAAALELAPHGITMNAVGPGTTLTPGTEGFYQLPGLREAFLDRTPLGRFGEPTDIARVVLMLASDYADWITGQLILADGGQSLLGLPRYLEGLEQLSAPRDADLVEEDSSDR